METRAKEKHLKEKWEKERGRQAQRNTRRRERKSITKHIGTINQTLAANSMTQGPSPKAASSLTSPEFPRILFKPKVHHRVHNSLPVVPVDSQMNPIHSLPSCFIKTHFNIIAPSKWRFYLAPTQRLTKLLLFDWITLTLILLTWRIW